MGVFSSYILDDEGENLVIARTLFIRVLQAWQHPRRCRSCVVDNTPSTPHPSIPFLPLGRSIPVCHVLSVRLQALLRPVQPSFLPSPPHLPSWQSLCISLHHLRLFIFPPSFQSSIKVSGSQLSLSATPPQIVMPNSCLFCSVCLTSNLNSCSLVCFLLPQV